jgi:hypothetical protein
VGQHVSLSKIVIRGPWEQPPPAEAEPAEPEPGGGVPGDGAAADRPLEPRSRDAGMSTVEYAVGTVVAAAFAAVLYQIVTGGSVISGLTDLINRALSTSF